MVGSLRSFERSDRDAVVELSRIAIARPELQVGNPVWTTGDELEGEIADWDPPPEETLLVVEDNGAVVGLGGFELPHGFRHAELFGPLVAAEVRGHRLGTQLLETSIEQARGSGADSLLGSVGTRNAAGRILLERAGFRARGRPQATFRLTPGEHRPLEQAPEGFAIRLATSSDLPVAIRLYRECFPDGRFSDDVWKENIANDTVYAGELEGQVVAVLSIDPRDRWIYHVGVTESERKRGVGGVLLSRALEDYWERHPDHTLGLDVTVDNVPAVRLYRRQGFAPWLVLQTYELPLQ
ncbi:MAG: GNAT family N-acetyltransferase [Actinobacteria bacterium]|nr:GNAT family N-acetyltransferase [Actinomycetota bacterium]